MTKHSNFFNEEQIRFLEKAFNVPRKDVIATIVMCRISADELVSFVKSKNFTLINMN